MCTTGFQGFIYLSKDFNLYFVTSIFTPHMQHEWPWGKVIGVGYICVYYVCGPKQFFNHTLAINSPFQTFAVVGLHSSNL